LDNRSVTQGVSSRPLAGQSAPLQILGEVAIFSGLDASQLQAVRAELRLRQLQEREVLIETDLAGDATYIIQSGYVRIQMSRADGEEVILAILGPGDIVGEMSLVDRQTRSATAIAHEATTVLVLHRTAFSALMDRFPVIGTNLARMLSRRLRLTNAHIIALATMDVDGRLAQQLLVYAREFGIAGDDDTVCLPFRLTQSEIASLVGASRVRVNQILGDFRRSGLVTIDSQSRITITDMDALEDATK
jgi:CRP/FNR family cyclic AMP-dependent transcriptional regulator